MEPDKLAKYDNLTFLEQEDAISEMVSVGYKTVDARVPISCRIKALRRLLSYYEMRQQEEVTANEVYASMPKNLQMVVYLYTSQWRDTNAVERHYTDKPDNWRLPMAWEKSGAVYSVRFNTGEVLHADENPDPTWKFHEIEAYPDHPDNPRHIYYELLQEGETE